MKRQLDWTLKLIFLIAASFTSATIFGAVPEVNFSIVLPGLPLEELRACSAFVNRPVESNFLGIFNNLGLPEVMPARLETNCKVLYDKLKNQTSNEVKKSLTGVFGPRFGGFSSHHFSTGQTELQKIELIYDLAPKVTARVLNNYFTSTGGAPLTFRSFWREGVVGEWLSCVVKGFIAQNVSNRMRIECLNNQRRKKDAQPGLFASPADADQIAASKSLAKFLGELSNDFVAVVNKVVEQITVQCPSAQAEGDGKWKISVEIGPELEGLNAAVTGLLKAPTTGSYEFTFGQSQQSSAHAIEITTGPLSITDIRTKFSRPKDVFLALLIATTVQAALLAFSDACMQEKVIDKMVRDNQEKCFLFEFRRVFDAFKAFLFDHSRGDLLILKSETESLAEGAVKSGLYKVSADVKVHECVSGLTQMQASCRTRFFVLELLFILFTAFESPSAEKWTSVYNYLHDGLIRVIDKTQEQESVESEEYRNLEDIKEVCLGLRFFAQGFCNIFDAKAGKVEFVEALRASQNMLSELEKECFSKYKESFIVISFKNEIYSLFLNSKNVFGAIKLPTIEEILDAKTFLVGESSGPGGITEERKNAMANLDSFKQYVLALNNYLPVEINKHNCIFPDQLFCLHFSKSVENITMKDQEIYLALLALKNHFKEHLSQGDTSLMAQLPPATSAAIRDFCIKHSQVLQCRGSFNNCPKEELVELAFVWPLVHFIMNKPLQNRYVELSKLTSSVEEISTLTLERTAVMATIGAISSLGSTFGLRIDVRRIEGFKKAALAWDFLGKRLRWGRRWFCAWVWSRKMAFFEAVANAVCKDSIVSSSLAQGPLNCANLVQEAVEAWRNVIDKGRGQEILSFMSKDLFKVALFSPGDLNRELEELERWISDKAQKASRLVKDYEEKLAWPYLQQPSQQKPLAKAFTGFFGLFKQPSRTVVPPVVPIVPVVRPKAPVVPTQSPFLDFSSRTSYVAGGGTWVRP